MNQYLRYTVTFAIRLQSDVPIVEGDSKLSWDNYNYDIHKNSKFEYTYQKLWFEFP